MKPFALVLHATSSTTPWTSQIIKPFGIVSDMSAYNGQGAIFRIDSANPTVQTVLWGPASANPIVTAQAPLACPMGITVEPSGTLLATSLTYRNSAWSYYGCAPAGIYRIDLVNRTQTVVSAQPQVNWQVPLGMAYEATGNFVVVDAGWGAVYRLGPDGTFQGSVPFSAGQLVAPVGIAVKH